MHLKMVALAAALILSLTPVVAVAQTTCGLATVFDSFREAVGPEIVGECSSVPSRAPNGDLTQATTRGLLTQRVADGIMLFSDETTTWLSGPEGLQSRPNAERLAWEGPAEASAEPPPAPPAAASVPPQPAANPTAAYERRCSEIIASTPNRGGPTLDQQWGLCVQMGEQHGPKGVDCYAEATKKTAASIGRISTETHNALFDATLSVCKASIR